MRLDIMDYYTILQIKENATKGEIKKQYHALCLKYHPDKNNGDTKKFLEIKEAFDTLYDDDKRKRYFITRLFQDIEFTEEDYQLFENYYYKIIQSNEFKLMKLLYHSIPKNAKKSIWERFKQKTTKSVVQSQRTIDILGLYHNENINLIVSKEDVLQKKLKIIHIITKNGIYYLYLRNYKNMILDNLDCYLTIRFYYKKKHTSSYI
tara:strand:- start:5487 stop:6104 length:618 start_codon:yes stop_codon:yes gene_type:complete